MTHDAKTPVNAAPRGGRISLYVAVSALVLVLAGGERAALPRSADVAGVFGPASSPECAASVEAQPPLPGTGVQTCVRFYLKSRTTKTFGWLARLSGKQDCVEDRIVVDPAKNWWETPAMLYQDPPIAQPDVAAGADCGELQACGSSSNVHVALTLAGHATLALKTFPRSDCMKGTITLKLTGSSQFHDDEWTPLFNVKEWPLVFTFDTRDPARPVTRTGTERRTVQVSFECYRRNTQKWSPKSGWPDSPERADMRTALYSRDAVVEVTGYRYDDVPSPSPLARR